MGDFFDFLSNIGTLMILYVGALFALAIFASVYEGIYPPASIAERRANFEADRKRHREERIIKEREVRLCGVDDFGNSKYLDDCGVCGGQNDCPRGCDGVPNSGTTFDKCGVCGGDGSVCA